MCCLVAGDADYRTESSSTNSVHEATISICLTRVICLSSFECLCRKPYKNLKELIEFLDPSDFGSDDLLSPPLMLEQHQIVSLWPVIRQLFWEAQIAQSSNSSAPPDLHSNLASWLYYPHTSTESLGLH